jgi:hypothetical protein
MQTSGDHCLSASGCLRKPRAKAQNSFFPFAGVPFATLLPWEAPGASVRGAILAHSFRHRANFFKKVGDY